jgi:hypothetical protein
MIAASDALFLDTIEMVSQAHTRATLDAIASSS